MKRTVEFLDAAQNSDGGWGYKIGGMSFVEPTAAVILALSQDAEMTAQVQRARAYLQNLQHADGGWGIAAMDDESGWMTAWAVWALAESDVGAARRGAEWLLQIPIFRVTTQADLSGIEKILKIDASVAGWPWQPGDASWVFPSALALLALDAVGMQSHARAQEGVQYLLDRAIAEGGWNVGNPYMVSGNFPPTVENTALALRALAVYGVENDVTQRGINYLQQENFTATAFEWAWRVLYLAQTRRDAARARAALNGMRRADGSWDANPFTTAIAWLGQRD